MPEASKFLSFSENVSFLAYILIPFVAAAMALSTYGIAYAQIGTTTSMIIMYVYLQAEYGRRMAEQENELTKTKVSMMMSQIQPHFLFNALNSIEMLCYVNSAEAGKAIHHFSKYLRGNMDSITRDDAIPFSQELEQLDNYLYIEKLRFPDIEFKFDIQCRDFNLPSLSLQVLVENAIKHGLSGLESGGEVTIATYEDAQNTYVSVRDNGVGFDQQKEQDNGRSHVGLLNVRKRLDMMSGGDLQIDSVKGQGATVTMRLPKK